MDILIIEDECLLADELEDKILAIDSSYRIVGKLQSIEESVEWLQRNSCDLIFMDIQLSDGLSFSIFEKTDVPYPVIFTTAYDEYAIQAFKVNSIAYLLKPVNDAEIKKVFDKYKSLIKSYISNIQYFLSEYSSDKKSPFKEKLTLTQGTLKKTVNVEGISHFQADGRYVFAFIETGKRFFCRYTLRELEDMLNPHLFFRINRTFIVNRESIKGWRSSSRNRVKVVFETGNFSDLIISRSKVSEFVSWLEN